MIHEQIAAPICITQYNKKCLYKKHAIAFTWIYIYVYIGKGGGCNDEWCTQTYVVHCFTTAVLLLSMAAWGLYVFIFFFHYPRIYFVQSSFYFSCNRLAYLSCKSKQIYKHCEHVPLWYVYIRSFAVVELECIKPKIVY